MNSPNSKHTTSKILVSCLLVPVTEDGEEIHEEVDDVQVEVQGGEDVLLGAEGVLVAPAHHQLGVVHDVQAASGKY